MNDISRNNPLDYYTGRIRSLQEQLENAQNRVALKDEYINKLEKALAETATKCAKLEKAYIAEAMRNVEV